jgi:hypothetical protein
MRQIKWNLVEFRGRELRSVHVFLVELVQVRRGLYRQGFILQTLPLDELCGFHSARTKVVGASRLWHRLVPWAVTNLLVKPASFLFYPEDGGGYRFLGNLSKPSSKLHGVTTLKTTVLRTT